MSNSTRLKTLDSALKERAKPALEQAGFIFDPKHRIFRRKSGACTQIIEFQLGTRSADGEFTVNLAVFHPDYNAVPDEGISELDCRDFHCLYDFRTRLSTFKDTLLTRLCKLFIKDPGNWFSEWLITPPDHWWKYSINEHEVQTGIHEILKLLESHGYEWLDSRSDPDHLKQQFEAVQRRQSDALNSAKSI